MRHIKRLDSLRAIAAILVIIWHWLPTDSIVNSFDNGAIGVNIFFVLSGFLITRILLNNRNEAEKLHNNKLLVFKNFYIRRSLRIFPVYYLLVFLIFSFHKYLGARFPKAEFLNSITYTINFYFFRIKEWGHLTVHFWSLAVEEQFYLFWPFIMLFVKRKYLAHAISLFILIGITSQCISGYGEFNHVPTYTCFDAFGSGALLAWIIIYEPQQLNRLYKILCILAIICFGILVIQAVYGMWPFLPQRTIHSVIALWMITYVVLDKGQRRFSFSAFLNNKFLFFLGKISYGIYLYHVPVQWCGFIIDRLLLRYFLFDFVKQYHAYILLLINFCLLICISWLSWQLVEKPILGLKKYFDYQTKQRSAKQNEIMLQVN